MADDGRGARSAAWGVVAALAGAGAIAVWIATATPGTAVPIWPAFVFGAASIAGLYMCFASLSGKWPAGRSLRGSVQAPQLTTVPARSALPPAGGVTPRSTGALYYPGASARTGWREYREQVSEIAPREGLLDRTDELGQMAGFCAGPESYWWWRAEAWAGKSALMCWFALNPPPGIVVVPFFITARYASQDDSVAFTMIVRRQLEELSGEDLPERLAEGTDAGSQLWLLLHVAVRHLQERSLQLVLVMDGLDEDGGADTGLPSIASMLPKKCEKGLKVIVASRPDPPVPADVPADHPLRDPRIVRQLRRSEHARIIRGMAEVELRRLLAGTLVQQNLLGLITAAHGGLTLPDLEDLTGLAPFEIEQTLHGASGRTFTTRAAQWTPRGDVSRVYLLAHETLQAEAERSLGRGRVSEYRDRLNDWAASYASRGWPANTPVYLLRGYFQMLRAAGDITRLTAYATDGVRHDRMLSRSGGDETALAEIITAQDVMLVQSDPDLAVMARLSMHRDDLKARNAAVPIMLSALWADLGQVERAEALARSMEPYNQAAALGEIAAVLAGAGLSERAGQMAESAEAVARSHSDEGPHEFVLARVAEVLAQAALYERAEAVAQSISEPRIRGDALARVAEVLAQAALYERAEAVAQSVPEAGARASALAEIAQALAGVGQRERAGEVAEAAETAARSVPTPGSQASALAEVAKVLAGAGLRERAGQVAEAAVAAARSAPDPGHQGRVLAEVAKVLARTGLNEGPGQLAEMLARSLPNPVARSTTLALVAQALAEAGLRERAGQVADAAESAARLVPDPGTQGRALAEIVQALARTLYEWAEAVARSISDPGAQGMALADLAQSLVEAGRYEQVEKILQIPSDPRSQTQVRERVVKALVGAGSHDQAEATARLVPDPGTRARALITVARAMAKAGLYERATQLAEDAEALGRSVLDPGAESRNLAEVAHALAEAELHEQAERVAEAAAAVAQSIPDPGDRDTALSWAVDSLGQAGLHKRAEAAAESISAPNRRAVTQARLAKTWAQRGRPQRAGHLMNTAEATAQSVLDPDARASALTEIAQELAEAGLYERAGQMARAAETAAQSILDPSTQAEALARMGQVLAGMAQPEQAGQLAEAAYATTLSLDPGDRDMVLAEVAHALAQAGQYDRAEAIAETIPNPVWQAPARSWVTQALAKAGLCDRAEAVARSVPDVTNWQGFAMAEVAEALIRAGLYEKAEAMARSIPDPDWRSSALFVLTEELVKAGLNERAELIVQSVSAKGLHAKALVTVATGLARAGESAKARQLIARAWAVGHWTVPLKVAASLEPQALLTVCDERLARVDRLIASGATSGPST